MFTRDARNAMAMIGSIASAASLIAAVIILSVGNCNRTVSTRCAESCGKDRMVSANTDRCVCVGGEHAALEIEAALTKAKQQAMTDAFRALSKAYEQ